MPWINQDMCAGCGVCVDSCPTGAIRQEKTKKARIDDDKCIRCGKCHDACPVDAIRHDSERIPERIKQNMEQSQRLLQHYDDPEEQKQFIDRMIRYYRVQIKVADQTIGQLNSILRTIS